MKIWVDISTAGEVLMLCPIIAKLEDRGHELLLTTRRSTETVPLADQHGLPHTTVGVHGGRTRVGKGVAIIWRAWMLFWFVRNKKIDLALSFSSFSQALVAYIMRHQYIALDDYEGNPGLHIVCRVARKIIVPNVFANENLYRYGASEEQIESYNGLKEDLYLTGLVKGKSILEELGISPERIIVTMRPPSEVAIYHQFENTLFDEALEYVAKHPNVSIVVLPRTDEQRQKYEGYGFPNVLIPAHVLDGPNLMAHSDLVIGAGGTMNREASVLGIPVYNMFKGRLGSVDKHLIESGKVIRIEDSKDLSKIRIEKKPITSPDNLNGSQDLVNEVVDLILANCT